MDDEPDIRDSVADLLRTTLEGVDVLVAGSGQEGLEVLAKEPVDLILTDYKMPGMNGRQFLEKARGINRNIPRILMTAFPDLDLAIRAVNEEGIEKFFTKPLDANGLVDAIREVLSQKQARETRDRAFARSLDALRRKAQ